MICTIIDRLLARSVGRSTGEVHLSRFFDFSSMIVEQNDLSEEKDVVFVKVTSCTDPDQTLPSWRMLYEGLAYRKSIALPMMLTLSGQPLPPSLTTLFTHSLPPWWIFSLVFNVLCFPNQWFGWICTELLRFNPAKGIGFILLFIFLFANSCICMWSRFKVLKTACP